MTTPNTAVAAPLPSASVPTATSVNAGRRSSERAASRRSRGGRVDRLALGAHAGHVAEAGAHLGLRALARHPLLHELLDALLEVEAQLGVDVGAEGGAAAARERDAESRRALHADAPGAASTSPTVSV